MLKVKLETRGANQFIQKLNDFPTANAEATKNALNTAAALSRKNAVRIIKNDFTLRNKFTERNIQFDKTSSASINSMESIVGATLKVPYMETQDQGGIKKKKGKNYALATSTARDGSDKNVINKSNYMSRVLRSGLKKNAPKINRGRRGNAVAQLYMANKLNKVINRNGKIYRVDSFAKMGRDHVKAKTTLLYSLRQSPITIRKTRWLQRAIEKPSRDLENIYISQIKKIWRKE